MLKTLFLLSQYKPYMYLHCGHINHGTCKIHLACFRIYQKSSTCFSTFEIIHSDILLRLFYVFSSSNLEINPDNITCSHERFFPLFRLSTYVYSYVSSLSYTLQWPIEFNDLSRTYLVQINMLHHSVKWCTTYGTNIVCMWETQKEQCWVCSGRQNAS